MSGGARGLRGAGAARCGSGASTVIGAAYGTLDPWMLTAPRMPTSTLHPKAPP